MDKKAQDELLLYWSGEADAGQAVAVEVLLKSNSEAREYLAELGELDGLCDKLSELPSMNSSRSFAAEAVAGFQAHEQGSRLRIPWLAGAAAVIALLSVGIKSWPAGGGNQSSDEIVDQSDLIEKSVDEPIEMRPKLSQRLFSAPRENSSLERISRARERAQGLRAKLHHLSQT
ncbi:hypothetical protein N8343_06000 [Akkermansiaceae bacterium]|nr:hypothetical protein [Akkermansiaceae bacterium]